MGLAENPEASIEIFDPKRHVRDAFSCGIDSLDEYFRLRARQDRDKYAAAIFVLTEGQNIVGYYTLSAYTINPGELPAALSKKLPRYSHLPATLIGRLAVDRQHQRRGFGEQLLLDALRRSLENTSEIGSVAVIVEAENEQAKTFYRSYGFLEFPGTPSKLFLPMQTIRELFRR